MVDSVQRLVLRNTLFLSLAQGLSIPLSILINAMMARYLGAEALGYMYLATTFNAFGYLAVDWGQGGALPALVAKDRSRAGVLLGTSLAWRGSMALVMSVCLNLGCRALGYGVNVRAAVGVLSITYFLATMVNACQETIVGFERTDVSAVRQVGEQVFAVLIVIPILLLGGKLNAALLGNAACIFLMSAFVWRSLGRVGVGRLSFDRSMLHALLRNGTPFVFFNLAMVLQPNVDAVILSKLAPPEVVGWLAASRKLMGPLIYPVSALIGALYPTLCRLHATDFEGFKRTTNGALRGTSLLVMPVALGCALYPDIGTTIYSRSAFSQAETNLRILSLHLFLMYFTMPIGVALLAGGKQRPWAIVQSLCVVVSVVLDPLLVPWFQRRMGNGGLGICTAAVVSEVVVVACGLILIPRGVFDRPFWRSLGLIALAGLAMAAVATLLRGVNSFVAAPLAVAAYVVALWVTGGFDKTYVDAIRSFVRRKFARAE